jgi:predicted flap endonuclease-1-like 5' DNA nuclease
MKELRKEDLKINISSNLTQIKGIGPKSAMELELAGVTTIADLAKRSPQHLAEKTGISITLISKWIVEANKLTK